MNCHLCDEEIIGEIFYLDEGSTKVCKDCYEFAVESGE